MVFALFELMVWVTIMLLLVSQVVVPFVFGRPWFPLLRRAERKRELEVQEELLRLGDEAEVARLEAELEAKRDALRRAREEQKR